MVTPPRHATARGLVAISLALIVLTTLQPTQAIVITPTFCIFCGPLGGVDFILNIFLFVPLGISLRWATGRWRTATIVGAATTLLIETLQWRLITGRDASLGDLLANVLGTMLGAWLATEVFRWLNATGVAARRYAAAFGVAAALVVTASAFLLQPVVPRYPQWVQWTPLRPNTDQFRGKLLAVELKGREVGTTERMEAREAFDTETRSLTMRAHIVPPRIDRSARRLALVVRITNGLEEGFALAQRGEAAAFRTHIAAVRVKLRSILVGLDGAFSPTPARTSAGELIIEGHSDPRAITVRRLSDGEVAVSVRRTVGLAWALLLPWDVAIGPQWWLANASWLAVLVLPVAFFTVRSGIAQTGDSRRLAWWPLALVLAALLATPVTGLSAPGPGEWLGVLAGLGAAVLLGRWTTVRTPANFPVVTSPGAPIQ